MPYRQSDVIGIGYRPRLGSVFFTRNGRRMDDAFIGLHKHNFFPTIAADGPAEVHVNLGQAGFVFIEANVKKWGLAPMVGNLPPPPAYGVEGGSVLIQTADGLVAESSPTAGPVDPALLQSLPPPPPISPLLGAAEALRAPLEGTSRLLGLPRSVPRSEGEYEEDDVTSVESDPSYHALPTPRPSGMDISLHSLVPPSGPDGRGLHNPLPASHGVSSHTTTRAAPRDYFSLPSSPPPYMPYGNERPKQHTWGALWNWALPRADPGDSPVTGAGGLRFPTNRAFSGRREPSTDEEPSDASRVPPRSRSLAAALVNSLDESGLFLPLRQVVHLPPSSPRAEPPPLGPAGARPPGPSPATRRPSSLALLPAASDLPQETESLHSDTGPNSPA